MTDQRTSSIGTPGQRRFVSLGAKLGISVVLVVTVASALTFVQFSRRERDSLVAAKRTAADMVADLFAASLSAPLDFRDEDGVQAELRNLRENREVTFAAVWAEGESQPFAKLESAASGGVEGLDHRESRTIVHADYVEAIRSISGREKKKIGAALVRFSLESENAAFQVNRVRIFWLCMGLSLGTMALLLVITRRQVLVPIESLVDATRRLAKGERGVPIPAGANDEIGRLARSFETMQAAIVDREQRLEEANARLRELFDHMRQAILVFGAGGRVEASESQQAMDLFGNEHEGRAIRELLYPGVGEWDAELQAFDSWIALAFDATAEHWPEIERLAPPEARIPTKSGERVLSLEFRPIEGQKSPRRIMLLATDETEKIRLKRDVAELAERHAAQMAAMRRLVGGGGQQFVIFLETARRRLSRMEDAVATPLDATRLSDVFQDGHTLKGEARAFELTELASVASGLEDVLAYERVKLLADGSLRWEGRELREALVTCRELLSKAEELFIDVSPTGRAVLDQVTVRRSDVDRICEIASKQGGELARLAERLSARSLGEVATQLSEHAPGWAAAAGKRASIRIDGREVPIPARLTRVLGGMLTHLVRNAIAHGIEAPTERERAGKPPAGIIVVRGESAENALAPTLIIEDDGRGVAENAVLSRAAGEGRPLDVARADSGGSFRPASSTHTDDLSGRGVGLNAVVHDAATAGYEVRVSVRESGGTRFHLVPRGVA